MMVKGIPLRGSDAKSGCRGLSAPMLAMYTFEGGSSGSLSMGTFQTLSGGKTGQPAICGPEGAGPEEVWLGGCWAAPVELPRMRMAARTDRRWGAGRPDAANRSRNIDAPLFRLACILRACAGIRGGGSRRGRRRRAMLRPEGRGRAARGGERGAAI